jgi:hypothetical protein
MTTTNAMAAASVQPKFIEKGDFSIVCTQALASNAASLAAYKLFNVASDVTIRDMYMRLATAASTAATLLNVGLATATASFIETAAASVVTMARATKGLPYTCTADTPIYAFLTAGDCTAASNLVVVAVCCAKDNQD